jgi:hypothetical protein
VTYRHLLPISLEGRCASQEELAVLLRYWYPPTGHRLELLVVQRDVNPVEIDRGEEW